MHVLGAFYAVSSRVCVFLNGLQQLHKHVADGTSPPPNCGLSSQQGELLSPCRCSGSVRCTHQPCLIKWISERGSWACELCYYKYQVIAISTKNPLQVRRATRSPTKAGKTPSPERVKRGRCAVGLRGGQGAGGLRWHIRHPEWEELGVMVVVVMEGWGRVGGGHCRLLPLPGTDLDAV